jgi:CBS domain-containing protein
MIVKELMSTKIITAKNDETVSQAMSRMRQNKIHQMPVIDDGIGMLLLKKIITSNIDASKAKVENFVRPVATLGQNEDVESAAEKILLSGLRALPVVSGKNIVGILSETDLLGVADFDYPLEKIMTPCDYVSLGDDVGKVKKLIVYKNISRLPVVDDGKVVGVIGMLDLIDLELGAKQHFRNDPSSGKEKMTVDSTPVESVMRNATIINRKKSLKDVIKMLKPNEEVIVDDGGLFIITPKDILELIARKPPGPQLYYQITNLDKEDSFAAGKIESAVREFAKKIGRVISNPESLTIHIDRHEKQGKKARYDIRTRLLTPMGLFVSHSSGWSLVDAVQDAVKNLEKEILKKYGKMADRSKEMRFRDSKNN